LGEGDRLQHFTEVALIDNRALPARAERPEQINPGTSLGLAKSSFSAQTRLYRLGAFREVGSARSRKGLYQRPCSTLDGPR